MKDILGSSDSSSLVMLVSNMKMGCTSFLSIKQLNRPVLSKILKSLLNQKIFIGYVFNVDKPPSTRIICPVMLVSFNKNTAVLAMSSALLILLEGCLKLAR